MFHLLYVEQETTEDYGRAAVHREGVCEGAGLRS